MGSISWKLFIRTYPFICSECKAGLWEVREICESCGTKFTIRPMTKKDYKEKMKRRE